MKLFAQLHGFLPLRIMMQVAEAKSPRQFIPSPPTAGNSEQTPFACSCAPQSSDLTANRCPPWPTKMTRPPLSSQE